MPMAINDKYGAAINTVIDRCKHDRQASDTQTTADMAATCLTALAGEAQQNSQKGHELRGLQSPD